MVVMMVVVVRQTNSLRHIPVETEDDVKRFFQYGNPIVLCNLHVYPIIVVLPFERRR